MLAAKVDAGAARAITQFSSRTISTSTFERVRAGIKIPIVPGTAGAEFQAGEKFAARCGTSFPAGWLSA